MILFILSLTIDSVDLGLVPHGQLSANRDGSVWLYTYADGLILSGKEYPGFMGELVGSPWGPGWAAIMAWSKGKVLLVGDDKLGPYQGIGPVEVSSDGKRVIYAYKKGGTWWVSTPDGVKGDFDEVKSVAISPDGSRWGFAAGKEGKIWVWVDGRRHGPYSWAAGPYLGGGRTLWVYETGRRFALVVDGEVVGTYESLGPILVSPAGHWALYCERGGKVYLMVDGRRHGPYRWVGNPVLSARGAHWATWDRVSDEAWRVILDGRSVGSFYMVKGLALSPDGSTLGFRYGDRRGGTIVVLGRERMGPLEGKVWGPFLGDGVARVFVRGPSGRLYRLDIRGF